MKKVMRVREWSRGRLLLQRDRKRIIDLCRAESQCIQDLARATGLNPGSVHNHVHKLHDAGFLRIESERVINGIVEKKYRRTALYFRAFDVNPDDVPRRNRDISRAASRSIGRVLGVESAPSMFLVTARLSKAKFAEVQKASEHLRELLVEADGTGDVRTEAVLCFGRA